MSEWNNIEEAPKDKRLLVLCSRSNGSKHVVIGVYCTKFRQEASDDLAGEEWCDYDEKSDTYFVPEGWYEQIENWDDLTACAFDTRNEVIGWLPIPDYS